jgi:hypothetical protein
MLPEGEKPLPRGDSGLVPVLLRRVPKWVQELGPDRLKAVKTAQIPDMASVYPPET